MRHAPAVWIVSPDAKALAAEKGAEQHFAYRATVTLDNKPILRAALYCNRAGYCFGLDQRRAGAYGRKVPAMEADAVEEVCARGGYGQAERRRQHDCH